MNKILIIEDEDNIRELIEFNLKSEGYDTLSCGDGKEGILLTEKEEPDLIMLDIMLPGMDGYEFLKSLRNKKNDTPVIMLTAKNDEVDKILGLEFGADDYITKPFSIRELKARIRAVLRRYEKSAEKNEQGLKNEEGDVRIRAEEQINIDGLSINVPAREVTVNGKVIFLSMKEFDLLKILAENRNRVLTREQLLNSVWGYEYYGETRTVDVHIRYLRKKLSDRENEYIVTVRGVGYKMI